MNQEVNDILDELISLSEESIDVLDEIYVQTEDEELRKKVIKYKVLCLEALEEMQNKDKAIQQYSAGNDIQNAKNLKELRKMPKEYKKRKMNFEVVLKFLER